MKNILKLFSIISFIFAMSITLVSAQTISDNDNDSNIKTIGIRDLDDSNKQHPVLGGDRDDHGCIPSAGSVWSTTTQSCVRPWLTDSDSDSDKKEKRELCKEFVSDLKIGDGKKNKKHKDVKDLQERLIGLGFLKASSTGYFGNDTQKALKAFQKENGILNSGYFGNLTKKAFAKKCVSDNLSLQITSSTTSISTTTDSR